MFLLAQLVEPPLQPGPVRLPNRPVQERIKPTTSDPSPVLELDPTTPNIEPRPQASPSPNNELPFEDWRPTIQGRVPYSERELNAILNGCQTTDRKASLNSCASALTAQFIQDGYINSRVFVLAEPPPGALEVVLGEIAELRVTSNDEALQAKVQQQLQPLIGTVLHLPSLEEALLTVRRDGVSSIKGTMGRLGSDPTKAVLTLQVEPSLPSPLQGDFNISNSGNAGSGEWRAVATLLQNNLLQQGDIGLLFLELDTDGQLELGTAVISTTYTWPLSENWSLTGSFGYSYRRFVEFQKPAYNFSFRTLQGLVQLETSLKQTNTFLWSASAALSANRNDSFESGGRPSIPLITGGANLKARHNRWDPWTRSGYLKVGTNISGITGNAFWSTNLYAMQGLAGLTPNHHLHNLSQQGIDIGEARALGGLADLSWQLSPSTTLKWRTAAQWAFKPLPGSMGFVLGSDVGLRGLPGTLVSGDSGWLSSGEIVWTLWQRNEQSFQLIPFIGMGGVRTTADNSVFQDTLGSGGLVGRYQNGRWVVELGWVDTFQTDDSPGVWNDWVLGNGLYSKLRYRF